MDPFSTLGVAHDATDAQIDAACELLLRDVTVSRWTRWQACLLGQSPARLLRARSALRDPVTRARCSAQRAWLELFFTHPPH